MCYHKSNNKLLTRSEVIANESNASNHIITKAIYKMQSSEKQTRVDAMLNYKKNTQIQAKCDDNKNELSHINHRKKIS